MNNTRYAQGGPYTIRDAQLIILSGHGMGNGTGSGGGYGIHSSLAWTHAGMIYVTHTEARFYIGSEQRTPTSAIGALSNKPFKLPYMVANFNGAGGPRGNRGCGVCHNNDEVTTNNNANSWCNKIMPIEVEVEEVHS